MNRRAAWILIPLLVTAISAAACNQGAKAPAPPPSTAQPSQTTPAQPVKETPPKPEPAAEGYYQNGVLLGAGQKPDFTQDVKQVVRQGNLKKLTNNPAGYTVDLPAGMALDFRYSPAYVRAWSEQLDIKISRERSPYPDVDTYLKDYPNRFIHTEEYEPYRKLNNIKILEDGWKQINGRRSWIIRFARTPAAGSKETQNEYEFAYVLTGGTEFYSFMFRTDALASQQAAIDAVLNSFTKVEAKGQAVFNLDLHPVLPKWNAETKAFYDQMVNSKSVTWGIFTPWALTKDYTRIASMEQKLDYHFPILLHYQFPVDPFPLEAMNKAWNERHQVVEMTMQMADGANDNAPRHNGMFDVLDGVHDQRIRQFARDAKQFGHPFLFRLNNEMNTDWSQYSGVLTLSDFDIYIKVWQRIYRIFEEEGVDNAIWIFNPNDGTYPPLNWNSHVSYYPGNEYVQMLGVTGYNTGDYKKDITGERWREFDDIYGHMAADYRPLYGKFPWIITEFASSSVGGDKAKWIRDMFKNLPKYPEIKAAVWWSYFDPDFRPGHEGEAARRYWLDEKDEYLQVFKEGLKAQASH